MGLSLNSATWIRDDGWLTRWSTPDTHNDEVQGSSGARDPPKRKREDPLRIKGISMPKKVSFT